MQEEFQNNFILLSKVAKEKKYAQEYLGLLARRGDIGSIRIGKRWYTTWQWFEEFLKISQKKKIESVCEVQTIQSAEIKNFANKPACIESEKETFPAVEKEEIKINVPFVFTEKEKIAVAAPTNEKVIAKAEKVFPQIRISRPQASSTPQSPEVFEIKPANVREAIGAEKKINMPVFRKMENRISSKNISGDIRRNIRPFEIKGASEKTVPRKVSIAEKNKHAIPYPEIKLRKNAGVFSPDLSREEQNAALVFPRFAFAMSLAIMLLLIAISGYFIYSGGLLARGQVAGASDERNGAFLGIKSGGEYFITNAGDQIKESLSVSRVALEAAKENGSANESGSQINAVLTDISVASKPAVASTATQAGSSKKKSNKKKK